MCFLPLFIILGMRTWQQDGSLVAGQDHALRANRSTAIPQHSHDANPGSNSNGNILRRCNAVESTESEREFHGTIESILFTSTVAHATTLLNHSLTFRVEKIATRLKTNEPPHQKLIK
jgi:hypothetical protein